MVLPDIFSRRKRQASGSVDPLQYDAVPQKVRRQILQVLDETFGRSWDDEASHKGYKELVRIFRKEQGVPTLIEYPQNGRTEFSQWFMVHNDIDEVIDATEVICRWIDVMVRQKIHDEARIDQAIEEVNARLLEASVGYQYESRQIIRADTRVLHKEVVVPALALIAEPKFASANSEYLRAFDAMRRNDFETALTECAKAFESVLKVIASEKGWPVASNATAKQLLQAAYDYGLIPTFLQSEFSGLRSILEGGVPAVRNKNSAHGAGTTKRKVPKHLASFQMHQTAAAIIFLIESQ